MDRRAIPFILVGLIVLGVLCTAREQSTAEQFFSEALRVQDISADVVVDGRTLSVHSGEVTYKGEPVTGRQAFAALRLAYARTLAERNPLFALPGTSPSDLTYAVDELEQTADQLANLQKDDGLAELIRTSLYPIDFLRTAARAEAARQKFIAHPDSQNEKAYYDAIRKESTSYIRGVHDFRNGVIQAVPDTTPPYVAAGKVVSKAAILSALQQLETGARKTRALFDIREVCLNGHASRCNPEDLLLPTIPELPIDSISSDSIRTASAIQSIYVDTGYAQQSPHAPLIVLSKSFCTSDSPNPPIYTVAMPHIESDIPALRRGIYIGEIRVIDIHEYENLPFYRDLQSRGIEFVLSPPLLPYECMEEARDLSAILFTEDVMKAASSTARIYYESEATRIVNARAREGASREIQYALSAQNHSTRFDQSLRNISWIEQTNINLIKSGAGADLRTYNLFFSRSGFASLFAASNPSFVGNVLLFDSISIPPSEQPYLYYSSFPDGKKKNKILEDIRRYISIHLAQLPTTR